jgi:hypothetical protein
MIVPAHHPGAGEGIPTEADAVSVFDFAPSFLQGLVIHGHTA